MILENIIGYIKSIFFNFKHFPLHIAVKLPIKICYGYDYKISKNSEIKITGNITRFMVKLGASGSVGLPTMEGGILNMESQSKLIIEGPMYVSKGTTIRLDMGAIIKIGEKVYFNSNCYIRSTNYIEIGRNTIFGWDVSIVTTDGHYIIDKTNDKEFNNQGDILIGNHCWIGNNNIISKNASILDNTVCAQSSLINKKYEEGNVIIGGVPGKILKRNINWKL